jgi:hypothetical protein
VNREKFEFMSLPRVPGRMNVEEAAWYLGFSQTDISILVGVSLLKPLGKPAPNGIRYFARPDLDQLCGDAKWLDRASAALGRHWRLRNARLSKGRQNPRKSRLEAPPPPSKPESSTSRRPKLSEKG